MRGITTVQLCLCGLIRAALSTMIVPRCFWAALSGVCLLPSGLHGQSAWRPYVLAGADFLNDSSAQRPALSSEVGNRRAKVVNGLLLQLSLAASERGGKAELGVTGVTLLGVRGAVGYRVVRGTWSPYGTYGLGVHRASVKRPAVGSVRNSPTVISTDFGVGVSRRIGHRELGFELRHAALSGAGFTRNRALLVGAFLGF